jgi:hypothetical protein
MQSDYAIDVSGSGRLRGAEFFQRSDVLQNHFHDVFISKFRVDHQVIKRTVGPVGVEIVTNERGALAVDFIYELQGFLFG